MIPARFADSANEMMVGHAWMPSFFEMAISLPLSAKSGEETLKVSLGAYYCQDGNEGLCRATSVVWTVPIRIAADAKSDSVALTLEAELLHWADQASANGNNFTDAMTDTELFPGDEEFSVRRAWRLDRRVWRRRHEWD